MELNTIANVPIIFKHLSQWDSLKDPVQHPVISHWPHCWNVTCNTLVLLHQSTVRCMTLASVTIVDHYYIPNGLCGTLNRARSTRIVDTFLILRPPCWVTHTYLPNTQRPWAKRLETILLGRILIHKLSGWEVNANKVTPHNHLVLGTSLGKRKNDHGEWTARRTHVTSQ